MGYYIRRPYQLTNAHDYEQMATQFTNAYTIDIDDVSKLKDVINEMLGAEQATDQSESSLDVTEFLDWLKQDVDDDDL